MRREKGLPRRTGHGGLAPGKTAAPMYYVTLSGNPVRDEDDNRFSVVDKRPVAVDVITAANMRDTPSRLAGTPPRTGAAAR